eukprot:TRINITY_DN13317_c0_g1_i1.p1 TRINITY_DN13317_c0_g1~~TRINITY_DN13317_c0_g1_i1.p1  ORF type:complete len:177 (-),score=6.44 TRINITY_DN13317_c0_g1_i1:11-541(-)
MVKIDKPKTDFKKKEMEKKNKILCIIFKSQILTGLVFCLVIGFYIGIIIELYLDLLTVVWTVFLVTIAGFIPNCELNKKFGLILAIISSILTYLSIYYPSLKFFLVPLISLSFFHVPVILMSLTNYNDLLFDYEVNKIYFQEETNLLGVSMFFFLSSSLLIHGNIFFFNYLIRDLL